MHWGTYVFRGLIDALLCSSLCFVGDAQKKQQALDLLTRAESLQDIRAKDGKPFHLHMQVHAERVVAKPADGVYDEIWLGPDRWRREISFPGFRQVMVGDADASWLSRNLDFRPRLVFLFDTATREFLQLGLWLNEDVLSVHNSRKRGVSLHCAQLKNRELCFDQAGALFSAESQDQRFEYEDLGKFGDKLFPRSIHVFESGKEVLRISVDDLSEVKDVKPELFQHDAGALQLAPCERWLDIKPSVLIKKVPPRYPPDERSAHREGTVILYALLSAEGNVEKFRVLEGAGQSFDRAAIEAVEQWAYAPVTCGPSPLRTEIEIRVNFRLQL